MWIVNDPDMDCTVAESCTTDSELSTATNSFNLENPVTAGEFLNFDNDTAAAEELSENWEDELVQRHE